LIFWTRSNVKLIFILPPGASTIASIERHLGKTDKVKRAEEQMYRELAATSSRLVNSSPSRCIIYLVLINVWVPFGGIWTKTTKNGNILILMQNIYCHITFCGNRWYNDSKKCSLQNIHLRRPWKKSQFPKSVPKRCVHPPIKSVPTKNIYPTKMPPKEQLLRLLKNHHCQ
jgi:hypothetical protein